MLRFVSTNMGVSEHRESLIWVVLIIRILLLRVRYQGPLFSETPISYLGFLILLILLL